MAIYDPSKLSKKMHNTIGKIQKYVMGFLES